MPDVWAKLADAKIWADDYLASFQQYPDIGRMADSDLDEFLAKSPFSQAQMREIKNSGDRQKSYIATYDRHRYAEVRGKLSDVSIALSKSGIFILPPLGRDIRELIGLIHSAVVEHQINQEEDVRPV